MPICLMIYVGVIMVLFQHGHEPPVTTSRFVLNCFGGRRRNVVAIAIGEMVIV